MNDVLRTRATSQRVGGITELNEDAHIDVTIFFSDRKPAGPYHITVNRITHQTHPFQ
jgi:hypothetical protein